jgi:RNA polymerase-associated protein CTR9
MSAYSNGLNGTAKIWRRFGDVPSSIDIPVLGDVEEAVELDLTELDDDPTELCTLLENENVAKKYWVTISLAYAKQNELDHAIEVIQRGLSALQASNVEDRISYLHALTWMFFCKIRNAPRLQPGKFEEKLD